MVQENNVHGFEDSTGTVLSIGEITDGEYLKRSGNNVVSDTPAGGNGGASNLFRVTRGTTQTMTKNSWVKIQFNTEDFDTGNDYDPTTNYRYTAPATGYYLFEATVSVSSSAGASALLIAIYKNGTTIAEGGRVSIGAGAASAVTVSAVLYLEANQYVEIYVYTASTSDTALEAEASRNHFSGCKLA